MTTRVAVIGVGGMGTCHARNIAELGGAEVAWVVDPNEAAGSALASDLGAVWTADAAEAIAAADAIVVASPDRFHADAVHPALDRGIPILCEKPLTDDLATAQAIVEHEVAIGRRSVMVGFMREFDEPHVQVRDALADLGSVHHLRCVHRNVPDRARSLSEILVQSLIHDLHTVRFLSRSEIESVHTSTVPHDDGSVRFVLLTCRLANGGVATLEFDDRAAGYEVFVEAGAERGTVNSAMPLRPLVRRSGAVGSEIGDDWFAPFLGTYRTEMRAWLDAIAEGRPIGPTAWDGFAAQVAVAAAERSGLSGQPEPVELPDRPDLYQETLT